MKARTRSKALIAGIAAAAALLLAPALSGASMASVSGTNLFFFAAPGETNNLTAAFDGTDYVLTDPGAAITPAVPCAAVNANQVKCPATGIQQLDLRLNDLNDVVSVAASVTLPVSQSDFSVKIEGGDGNDTITGAANVSNLLYGDDSFSGGTGNDTVTGGTMGDALIGAGGNDALRGVGGNDQLWGDEGNDLVDGGAARDSIFEGSLPNGADVLIGGSGFNSISYADRTTDVSLSDNGLADDGGPAEGDNINSQFLDVLSGEGNDTITGSATGAFYWSGDGDDTISAGGGSDEVSAGRGDDNVNGGDGADKLGGGEDGDTIDGGPGDDTINDGFDDESGSNADVYRGGSGTDRLVYSSTEPLSIDLDGTADDGRPGENDLAGADLEDLIGGSKADILTGNNSANQFDGGPGNDQISGLGGPDALLGGPGDDSLNGGTGIDTLDGAGGVDRLRSRDSSPDDVECGSSTDTLLADSFDDFTVTCDQSSIGSLIKGSKAKLNRKSKTKVKVSCPVAEGIDCKVKITATKGKKTLARGAGKVQSGNTSKVTIKLTKAGKKARSRKLTLKTKTVLTDATGAKVTTTLPKLVLTR